MVITVLTSTSSPIFIVFLFILGVLIFANISKYYTFLISSLPLLSLTQNIACYVLIYCPALRFLHSAIYARDHSKSIQRAMNYFKSQVESFTNFDQNTNQNVLDSVQFSHSVMSNSLQPHGLQHARLPCPSPTPRACSDSCPSSW